MKSNINTKLNDAENNNNEIKRSIDSDTFISIFKLNNGQALARKLSKLTGTKYEYVYDESTDDFKFVNKSDMCVKINKTGNIINWAINVNWPTIMANLHSQTFAKIAQDRLNKTNEMLKSIGCYN
ncbi:MAG TPA: hypothetical protein GXZ90_01195 [Clostridiales bacterium]|nr:hypothetical protein [Clostridiales bacterium]